MLSQMVANDAAALNAFSRTRSRRAIIQRTILIALVGPLLAGCAKTAPLVGADPAGSGAKAARIGHRPGRRQGSVRGRAADGRKHDYEASEVEVKRRRGALARGTPLRAEEQPVSIASRRSP